jgi:hypothetical protein
MKNGLIIFALSVVAAILKAITVSWMWHWYVAGPFDIMEIGVVHAFGLCLLMTLATAFYVPPVLPHDISEERMKVLKFSRNLEMHIFYVLHPVFVLPIGWLFS